MFIIIAEKSILKTEVLFNEDKTERYLLRKIWDDKKPIVSLVMTNPSKSDVIVLDMTSFYAINNIFMLDYGGVDILNISSVVSTKIDSSHDISLSSTNLEEILKSVKQTEKTIIAWGRLGENNKKIRLIQLQLLEKLKPFEEKLYHISNEEGECGFHVLAPKIRSNWILEKFVLPEYLQTKENNVTKKSSQSKIPKKIKEEV